MKKKLLIINGPNLNLLGQRETNIYGEDSLESIINAARSRTEQLGYELSDFQSNHEGEIIDTLHAARDKYDGIILNAGAYTHYSIAIRDAIVSTRLPCVEVHLSNVYKREEFRHKSVIAPVCVGVIAGFGKTVYTLAVEALAALIEH